MLRIGVPAAGVMPLPVNGTESVPSPALDKISTLALRLPAAVGLNDTFTVQVAPAASEVPQPLVWLKSDLCVPAIAIDLNCITPLPVFFSVRTCAADCEPMI